MPRPLARSRAREVDHAPLAAMTAGPRRATRPVSRALSGPVADRGCVPARPRSEARPRPSPPAPDRRRAPAARRAASRSTGRSGRGAARTPDAGSARGRAGTAAGTVRRSREPARTGVHRRDELEPGGERRRPTDPRDRDPTLLHRLAERLEDVASELRQLVEEQHALIGQRDLAGRQVRSAADHRGVRDRVVRRPESGPAAQLRDRALAGGRGDDRRRQRGRVVERRQQAGDRPREQRLARPGRTDQEQAVATGQRDLEPAPCLELAAHLARSGTSGTRPAPMPPRRPAVGDGVRRARSGGAPGRRRPSPADDARRPRAAWPRRPRRSRRRAAPRRPPRPRRRPAGARAADSAATIGRMPGTARTSPPSDSSPMSAIRPGPAGPVPSRAGCPSPSRGRATPRPCAGPPARG